MTKSTHAKLAPSASKRWLACPGSIKLCEKLPPQKDTAYSIEGTQAHHLAEHCLRTNQDASELLGNTLTCQGERYTVDNDMADAVQVYLDQVRILAPKDAVEELAVILKVEEKFDLSWLHPGMFGSNDACVYDVSSKKLSVLDYKNGFISVDPEWNSQLMIYAIGAMHAIWSSQTPKTRAALNVLNVVEDVELIIVQPNGNGGEAVKTWGISASNLWFWARNVLKPGAEETEKEGARMSAGDHCRFCPALAVCPEQLRRACEVAKVDFGPAPVLPPPEALTPNDLAKVMATSELFNVWSKEVRAYAQAQAESGFRIPGYKLVSRRAERKWLDESQTASVLEEHLNDGAYATRKVLSVAQAEKALKKVGVSPEATLDGLWEKPESGLTLVADEDRREEKQNTVVLDFLDDADFLQ